MQEWRAIVQTAMNFPIPAPRNKFCVNVDSGYMDSDNMSFAIVMPCNRNEGRTRFDSRK
jgi:hypothetical protein